MTQLAPASQWILSKFRVLETELESHLQDFEIAHSIDQLYSFLWDNYADWYVEYLKTDSSQLEFAKDLFRQYTVILSPYMPFETEAIWNQFFGENELLATVVRDQKWSKAFQISTESVQEFENVRQFIQSIRSIRGLFAIDPGTLIQVGTQQPTLLSYQEFVLKTAKIQLIDQNPSVFLYQSKQYGFEYGLDILDYIPDKSKEIERTDKLIGSLEKQILSLNAKLAQEKFIQFASPEVIEKVRKDLADRQFELTEQTTKKSLLNT